MAKDKGLSTDLVARLITRCAEHAQLKVRINGLELTPEEAFVGNEGMEAMSGYLDYMHKEVYKVTLQQADRPLPLSVAALFMVDALGHALTYFKSADNVVDLDAMRLQFGVGSVPVHTMVEPQ